ncbi:MAG: hypothetical protein ACON5E_07915, partial [Flavobacteriales bacterium]
MFRLIFIFLSCPILLLAQNQWQSQYGAVRSYSSPRATDLNQDGVLDIVVGSGVDGFPSPFGAIALDGTNGNTLWTMESTNEIYSSPIFYDYNNDAIEDVIIAGRDAELRLIDGSNGELIWKFWNDNSVHPNDSGWFNFYNPQIIIDVNGDGYPELLCANGGDHSLDDIETNRPAGHLLVINGINGEILNKASVPDSNETYMSPLFVDLNNDENFKVIFGTGGETIAGNLWVVDFSDLLDNNISSAIPLLENTELGLIAPPSIADINNDGSLDIVCQNFDGTISAINGDSFDLLWDYQLPNTESSASPILGNFTPSDNNIDVFATLYSGGSSSYNDFYQILLDGETGQTLFIDSIGDFNFSTPIAFDANNDGNDEVLISVTNFNPSFTHELILIDFVEESLDTIFSNIGGDVWSSPLATDLDNNGQIELISVSQNNNPFIADGIQIQRQNTPYEVPTKGISWGTYMGNNYDGHFKSFFKDCDSPISLYLYPSSSCPSQNTGSIGLLATNSSIVYAYCWSNGATTSEIDNLAEGNYNVIVTDTSGCQVESVTNVNAYTTTVVTEDASENGAADGWAYFNISGCSCNSSNCQYSWYTNDSLIIQGNGSTAAQTYKYLYNLSAGTYIAEIVMPNGCQVSQEIIINDPEIEGCTDPLAGNYNSQATTDDGSCHSPVSPCEITPNGLVADNIIHNRVVFNWDAPAAAPSYYMIRYRAVGTSQWTVMRAGPETANAFTGT